MEFDRDRTGPIYRLQKFNIQKQQCASFAIETLTAEQNQQNIILCDISK
jgi:hypothetical protein